MKIRKQLGQLWIKNMVVSNVMVIDNEDEVSKICGHCAQPKLKTTLYFNL